MLKGSGHPEGSERGDQTLGEGGTPPREFLAAPCPTPPPLSPQARDCHTSKGLCRDPRGHPPAWPLPRALGWRKCPCTGSSRRGPRPRWSQFPSPPEAWGDVSPGRGAPENLLGSPASVPAPWLPSPGFHFCSVAGSCGPHPGPLGSQLCLPVSWGPHPSSLPVPEPQSGPPSPYPASCGQRGQPQAERWALIRGGGCQARPRGKRKPPALYSNSWHSPSSLPRAPGPRCGPHPASTPPTPPAERSCGQQPPPWPTWPQTPTCPCPLVSACPVAGSPLLAGQEENCGRAPRVGLRLGWFTRPLRPPSHTVLTRPLGSWWPTGAGQEPWPHSG